jgi:hypothetical protein
MELPDEITKRFDNRSHKLIKEFVEHLSEANSGDEKLSIVDVYNSFVMGKIEHLQVGIEVLRNEIERKNRHLYI